MVEKERVNNGWNVSSICTGCVCQNAHGKKFIVGAVVPFIKCLFASVCIWLATVIHGMLN